jgi:phage terminase large subunit-like protein
VVAIDPAVSSGEDADETGIIVAGIDRANFAYVLDDKSLRAAPHDWAQRAIAAYRGHRADRIIAEINQGGQMVEATLRMIDSSVSYQGVHAKRGKVLRAEPVSALYEQKRVRHVGAFPQLEDQMCSYGGFRSRPYGFLA